MLNVTEKQARAEIEERNKIQESIKMVDTLRKEEELREAAKEARQKKMNLVVSNISSVDTRKTDENGLLIGNKRNISNEELEAAKIERNNLRNQRKKEIERDRRIEVFEYLIFRLLVTKKRNLLEILIEMCQRKLLWDRLSLLQEKQWWTRDFIIKLLDSKLDLKEMMIMIYMINLYLPIELLLLFTKM